MTRRKRKRGREREIVSERGGRRGDGIRIPHFADVTRHNGDSVAEKGGLRMSGAKLNLKELRDTTNDE